jgi:hypothetical protein
MSFKAIFLQFAKHIEKLLQNIATEVQWRTEISE